MRGKYYHHIWVRSLQFRGNEALTYHHDQKLLPGSLVHVPLRQQQVLGIVMAQVSRPKFPTKPITGMIALPPLPSASLQLALWLQNFYPAPLGAITSLFVPPTLSTRADVAVGATASHHQPSRPPRPALTAEQVVALAIIQTPDTYLLHGRTGSGKTRVYMELAERTLASGRSVMILTPEIGLISQLATTFSQTFGTQIVILHSRLSVKQRLAAWRAILTATTPLVVVGPRSVLFTPLKNLGLIVVDESHDPAYKQEQAPHYHAVRVASKLSNIHNAILLLGSATPSVADYYLARQRQKNVVELSALAIQPSAESSLTVVDLKDRSLFTRSPHLSLPLIEAMARSLAAGEQILLYLNRRGTARVVVCEQCSWQANCPNCDLPLIYHGDQHTLLCHLCGYRQPVITTCPACHYPAMSFHSFGTKAIVDEARKIFPEARILRFDADNLQAERLERQYQRLAAGEVDILVGTQMVAKGLDLPRLSTLGVILADSSLYTPDYTAQERTYQLLNQVIGRIGRGHVTGHAVVQTYHPDSPLMQAALHNDWQQFYDAEIKARQRYRFPPFCHLLKLTISRASAASAEKAAKVFRDQFEPLDRSVIEGPAPAFHEKINGTYRWQLVVKASRRRTLIDIVERLPKNGWSYDLDPNDLL